MTERRHWLPATVVALLSLFAATMGIARLPLPTAGAVLAADAVLAVALALGIFALARALRLGARLDALDALAAAYWTWAAIDLWVAGPDRWSTLKLLGIGALVGLFVVARTVITDEATRRTVMRAWLAGAVVLALFALAGSGLALAQVPSSLYSSRGGDLGLSFRAVGLATTSNMLAQLLLPPLIVLGSDAALFRRARPLQALLFLTFALTLSRTMLAFVFALGVRAWNRPAGRALVVATALATIVLFRLDVYRDHAAMRITTAPGVRYRLAAAALHTASAHPLFGLGPGRYAGELPWPRPEDPTTTMDAHATPINVAATLGVPALCFFLALCVGVLCRGRGAEPLRAALALALAATFFDALTMDIEDFRHLWLLLALVAPRR